MPPFERDSAGAQDSSNYRWKQGAHAFPAEGENPFYVIAHEQPIHQSATARVVTHVVHAKRPAIALLEGVSVMPEPVGAAKLGVHELLRRIPARDLGSPT